MWRGKKMATYPGDDDAAWDELAQELKLDREALGRCIHAGEEAVKLWMQQGHSVGSKQVYSAYLGEMARRRDAHDRLDSQAHLAVAERSADAAVTSATEARLTRQIAYAALCVSVLALAASVLVPLFPNG